MHTGRLDIAIGAGGHGFDFSSLLDAYHKMNSAGNKPASLLVAPLGEALSRIPHLREVDRWPVTHKRARYSTLIAFSRWEDE